MAAVVPPQTPQRPLPGGYVQTPAVQQQPPPPATIFAQQLASLRNQPPPPTQQSGNNDANQAAGGAQQSATSNIDRAANAINEALYLESARFPGLESYITQGISGTYETPPNSAWLPFQRLKLYDLPQAIIEQANQTSTGLMMGLFPEIGHCWAAMDNCLYLWDYKVQGAELIGFEENPFTITSVKLVKPKPGVFVKQITDLIVVSTSENMMLLGVAANTTPTGNSSLVLYNTKMAIPTRGLNVQHIEGSKKDGRIFFLASEGEDIFEFYYQQDEGWFSGKTHRLCHTRSQYDFVPAPVKAVGSFIGGVQKQKKLIKLILDDSRGLLYTLSSTSEIKVWSIRPNSVALALARPLQSLLQNTGHFSGNTRLLYDEGENRVCLVGLDAIPATEAGKLTLVATTNTGCRLYLSTTRGYGYQADGQNAPTSMQILHIRFPPKDPSAPPTQPLQHASPMGGAAGGAPFGGSANTATAQGNVDVNSQYLKNTESAQRFPPGYFLAAQPNFASSGSDQRSRVFCCAPDFARLKNPQDHSSHNSRFVEFGQWIDLSSWFAGASIADGKEWTGAGNGGVMGTAGFGNEMALQFSSQTSTEIAIMTGVGVQTIRRRRLVDILAGVLRYGNADTEGEEGGVKRFVSHYGRAETAATAIAVACGQGMDVTGEGSGRVSSVTDSDVLEAARKAFIEQGGKPEFSANAAGSADPVDSVTPSPRYQGLALYVSRLVRGVWKSTILKDDVKPGMPPTVVSTVNLEILRTMQRDLASLKEFLDRNKPFIEGLSGSSALNRVATRGEEFALQGEHRAMQSILSLIGSIGEGLNFVLVLFDEKIDDILALLAPKTRGKTKQLTFESLFVSPDGKELAKELVKAIVNRNIANGSNVDTVAEALRRRCGTFCSSEDVVIFKAQEQVKRASEAGGQSESGRVLLNESQRLFSKVAGSLGQEHLQWAIQQYIGMAFYAGAIQLCLTVAGERDRARRALGWLREGMSDSDPRYGAFDQRKQCYDLIFEIIKSLDQATESQPAEIDGRWSLAAKRRAEAYDVVNESEDAVFQTCLFDWYVAQGREDRLLDIGSPFVVEYLKQRSREQREAADLLWRYYAHHNDFLAAAATQVDLAKGFFELSLEERIGYLSRARTNASTRQSALMDSRGSKQQLLREISDLLDVAAIQDDLLQRMKAEPRLTGERRQQVLQELERSRILPVDELFNGYTDQAGYHDLNLLIYQVADHRNPADIKASWEQLVQSEHDRSIAEGDLAHAYERVGLKVQDLGRRLGMSDATFPIQILLPLLERYAIEPQEVMPPPTWAVALFFELDVPHASLLPVLENMYYGNEHPFTGSKRKVLAGHMVFLIAQWMRESERRGERVPLGSEESAALASDCLASLVRSRDLDPERKREAEEIVGWLGMSMR
ncbi:nucleoporin-domain-containing protein [Hortaea werneckii]|nr:nucleoporin-domain-containing protein [Hortaea werneckii]